MINKKKTRDYRPLLIITTTLPIHAKDRRPRFILDLALNLKEKFKTTIIAPSEETKEKPLDIPNIRIIRHRYFIKKYEILTKKNSIMDNLEKNKIFYLLIPLFLISQLYSTIKETAKNKKTIINAHWLIPQGLTAVLVKTLFSPKSKVIITCHGADIYALKLFNPLKKWVLKKTDHTIFVSDAMKNHCKAWLPKNAKSSVIPMGIDTKDTFMPKERKPTKDLIFVGRLSEKKGIKILIEALKILSKNGTTPTCSIIGSGKEEPEAKRTVKKNSLSNVTFYGQLEQKDIAKALHSHHIFIFPSIIAKSGDREGLGLAPIEAMACGCCVIASDLETSKDFISHEKTGLLFKAGDPNDLAKNISRLIDNSSERERLSVNGQKYVINKFSWENSSKKYASILETI